MEGRLLAGRYRLLSLLGKGGMGSVWVAEHIELRTRVAVKLIDLSIASSDDALARFKREAQAAATLRSTHVVQILDYGVDGETPFIAMELLSGESLAGRLKRLGALSPEATASIITQTARAVGKAHEIGVVHRDLKPDNIFIVCEEDQEVCKVLDFGIAKQTLDGLGQANGPQTQTGALLGTPFYMSPEQASGKRQVDHRTDIWAMAVIAFECLLGRRPFQEQTLGALLIAICTEEAPVPSQWGQVPPGFDEWFARGVAKDPDHRFGSAREAASTLQALCTPGLAWQAAATPTNLSGQGLAVGAADAGAGQPAAQAVTAPSYSGAGHAAAPVTGGVGAPVGDSTGTQMPPSVVTMPGVARHSGTKLVLLGLTAGAVLVSGAGLLVLRTPEPKQVAPSADAASAETAATQVVATTADGSPVEPIPAASTAAAPSAPASESNAKTESAPPTRRAPRVTPTPAKPRLTPGTKPTRAPAKVSSPAPAPQPSPKTAKDQLDDGFGF